MSNDSGENIFTLSSTDAESDILLCVDEQPEESCSTRSAVLPVPLRGLKREVTFDRLDVENAKKKARRDHKGIVASNDAASSPGLKIVRFTTSTFEKVSAANIPPSLVPISWPMLWNRLHIYVVL